ncbi:ExbD/TolR family protein [Desulfomicrobium orale]|uniref:Protein TolR n=1 Tax=Desulfomicrobium orale DSM 12838 TaxID=888061 RepID=A0A109W612_9BACT|nr:ExbD/TolR family protein [Desulfomicrobium orale]AMD92991.1 protein TolR [Desulfomicrobium orale DSM 12838]
MQLNGKGFLAEINVTPFVDVMLVLLIIFMVTAPMLTQGVEVDLPETKTVETLPEDSETVVLKILKDGTIKLDKYEVKLEELGNYLKRMELEKGNLLYLQADKDVAYGTVVKVMAEVRAAGVQKLGVVAEPEDEK